MLRVEVGCQRLADRGEGLVVGARDDQRRDACGAQLLDRDHRLPRPSLAARVRAHPRASSGGSGVGGSKLDPTARRKTRRNASGSSVGPVSHNSCAPGTERVSGRVAARRLRARRLDHGQRRERVGSFGRGQERDHPAVRVADEMVAGSSSAGDHRSLAARSRPGRPAGPEGNPGRTTTTSSNRSPSPEPASPTSSRHP